MDFADLVLKRLDELDLNVNQAELRAGLPQGYIRGVVRMDDKRAVPNIEKAERIARALGLEVYVGKPRSLSGFSEAPSQLLIDERRSSGQMAVPLPWHDDAREATAAPVSFTADWFSEHALIPDNLRLARVHCWHLPTGGLGKDRPIVIVDVTPMQRESGPYAFRRDGKIHAAFLSFARDVTVISLGIGSSGDGVDVVFADDDRPIKVLGAIVWSAQCLK